MCHMLKGKKMNHPKVVCVQGETPQGNPDRNNSKVSSKDLPAWVKVCLLCMYKCSGNSSQCYLTATPAIVKPGVGVSGMSSSWLRAESHEHAGENLPPFSYVNQEMSAACWHTCNTTTSQPYALSCYIHKLLLRLGQKFRSSFGWTPSLCALQRATRTRNQVPGLPGVPQNCQHHLGMGWARAGIWLLAAKLQPAYHRCNSCT